MSQGFNPHRHKIKDGEQIRWVEYADVADDPIPTDPDALRVLIPALRDRIRLMDRTTDKRHSSLPSPLPDDDDLLRRIVVNQLNQIDHLDRTKGKQLAQRILRYIQVMAQRDRWPGALELNWHRLKLGHYEDLFHQELQEIARGKLVPFKCLPAVLRLQRDLLYEYMKRDVRSVGGVLHGGGYASKDSPTTWLQRNATDVHEQLSFYKCICDYRPDLSRMKEYETDDDASVILGPGDMIPAILSILHSGMKETSIRQVLKPSARKSKVPDFLR